MDSVSPSSPPLSGGTAVDGRVLAGRYRLERRIGQGGMAEVWVATDVQLNRRVAVKWLKPNLATDPVVAERFRREAIAVAGLNHPNIVGVHDAFEHEGRQAVVMQLVDGRSLRQVLDSQKLLGPELTIHIGASVAAALDEAHRSGFVHRDVKPGNILITNDGRVLLTDFGIAKGLESGDHDLTSDNVMMGTAKYLSPEQVRGHRLDGRADLYSLALVLYECLAGRVPFLGQSDADTALARLQRDPTDLAHLRPTLPIGLVNLIHRTLARNPAHRPATGEELRRQLQAVDTTPPDIDGTPLEPPTPRERPVRPDESGRLSRTPVQRADAPTADPDAVSVGAGAPSDGAVVAPARPPAPAAAAAAVPGEALSTDRVPVVAPVIHDQDDWTTTVRSAPTRTALLVLLAVVAAAVAALVVWNRGDERTASDSVSPLPSVTAAPAVTDGVLTEPAIGALNDLETPAVVDEGLIITAWDPFGDNGGENNAQASLAVADGSRSTAWSTECYSNQYMGAKPGV
jgi:tRNA A-37 threonylcarbamoyl transferase component Bud32